MVERTLRRLRAGRLASAAALAGAVLQVAYGVLACVWTYPRITDRPFEVVWGLATLGMMANVLAWLAIDVARPRRLAVTGGAVAIAGFAARFVISVVIVADPDVGPDTASINAAIPVTIAAMFGGLALLGIATRRARRLDGAAGWAPLLVLAGGLIAAPFYSFDKVVHFILLGLLWGSAWLYMALVGYRQGAAEVAVGGEAGTLPAEPATADVGHREAEPGYR
jgi:FtsH-binding integral membrane protein